MALPAIEPLLMQSFISVFLIKYGIKPLRLIAINSMRKLFFKLGKQLCLQYNFAVKAIRQGKYKQANLEDTRKEDALINLYIAGKRLTEKLGLEFKDFV